jgi:hypothetical protein
MTPVNQFYLIGENDVFVPLDYPEIEKELSVIKNGVAHMHSKFKGEMIVSYFKDHCLKNEWVKDYPELTELIISRQFITTHLQALFSACRNNKAFLVKFEQHIQNNFISENQ